MIDFVHDDVLNWAKNYSGNKFHAMFCDPPAGINFMNMKFDTDHGGRDKWIANMQAIFEAIVPHLHPGAHCIVWALPRTSHWTATALENAGLEIREVITHVNGQGFPKSQNVEKALDKQLGGNGSYGEYKTPEHAVKRKPGNERQHEGYQRPWRDDPEISDRNNRVYIPETESAKTFSGFGSALKPSSEHWIIARKPLIGTIAENCLRTGAGALNIDAGRIGSEPAFVDRPRGPKSELINQLDGQGTFSSGGNGRWPANFVLSHLPTCNGVCADDCPIRLLGEQSGESASKCADRGKGIDGATFKNPNGQINGVRGHDDEGTAARFFFNADFSLDQQEAIDNAAPFYYCSKAPTSQRSAGLDERNTHPTLKNLKLTKYLASLLLPPDAYAPRRLLVPFAGVASEVIGGMMAGFEDIVGIEREQEYCAIAHKRIAYWQTQHVKQQPTLLEVA